MKPIELKFLLKLLGYPNYRAAISNLQPNEKTSASERDKICRNLTEREIVEHSREIKKFKLASAGKSLLKQDISQLPLTEQQITVLKACQEKAITPSTIKKIAADERQPVLKDLEAKGLIKVEKDQIREVWLTEQGTEYLREEFNPSGNTTISLTLEQLGNYTKFLRRAVHTVSNQGSSAQPASSPVASMASHSQPSNRPSDAEILSTIENLDQNLGTENYLPIFHLRQKLQPPLSREELDQALYRLQRQDKIEMSSLVEAVHYTSEQIQAGISQDLGSPLFFISLNQET